VHDALYEQLAQVEDRLWWHHARRAMLRSILKTLPWKDDSTALDIGCGTGGTMTVLHEFTRRVFGIDRAPQAVAWARRKCPHAEVLEADANRIGELLPPGSIDVALLLNVLEHEWVPDVAKLLSQLVTILKPGGAAIISVSAWECLRRRHDRMAMSQRRFRLRQLRALVGTSGLCWISGNYFNLVSFLPAWISARWDRVFGQTRPHERLEELALPPLGINSLMKGIMASERMAMRLFGRLPLGVSLICTARKPVGAEVRPSHSMPWISAEHLPRSHGTLEETIHACR
jgi:SAM-dependent methyltransferase